MCKFSRPRPLQPSKQGKAHYRFTDHEASRVTDWERPATSSASENGGHTAIRIAAAPPTWPDADGQLPLRPSRAGSMAVRWPRLRNAFCSATE